MGQDNVVALKDRVALESRSALDALLREGARTLLQSAIEAEVAEYLAAHRDAREQRCWVHKTANVLDKLPKRVQPHAKALLHEMYLAPTKADASKAFERFIREYEAKHPKAAECLRKDRDVLFTFYDFPAEHWAHLRTSNPIESTFATVRHRTRQTKGCGSRLATLTMVFKLATQAEKHWRRLNGYELLSKVIQGVKFTDGVLEKAA